MNQRLASFPRLLPALLVGISGLSLAQPPDADALAPLRAWAAAGAALLMAEPPARTVAPPRVAAIVPRSAHTAAIAISGAVRPGTHEIVARSKPFTWSRESNFGALVGDFRFSAPDRIELTVSARDGCARRSSTHKFALRNGVWLVTGLDESALRCTDQGVEQDWSKSANYLTGKAVRTTFSASTPAKVTQGPATRRAFPLSEFPPPGPERVYAEMQ